MTLTTKAIVMTAITFATTLTSFADAEAGCCRRRRSCSRTMYVKTYTAKPYARIYVHPKPQIVSPSYPPPAQFRPSVPPPAQQQFGSPMQSQRRPQFGIQAPQQSAQQLQFGTPPSSLSFQQTQSPIPAAPATQRATPGIAPTNNAQMSALQALSGMSVGSWLPQQNSAPSVSSPPALAQTPSHVGNWTASIDNGARVQLSLRADGMFTWMATNKSGQTSKFEGSYTLDGGSMTLTRSNDNQKLNGTLARTSNNTFNFKLAGATDDGLNFVRG